MVKLALVCPALITTDDGTLALAGAVETRLTVTANGAADGIVTVPLTVAPFSVACTGTVTVIWGPAGEAVIRMSSIPMPSVGIGNSSTWLKRMRNVEL